MDITVWYCNLTSVDAAVGGLKSFWTWSLHLLVSFFFLFTLLTYFAISSETLWFSFCLFNLKLVKLYFVLSAYHALFDAK